MHISTIEWITLLYSLVVNCFGSACTKQKDIELYIYNTVCKRFILFILEWKINLSVIVTINYKYIYNYLSNQPSLTHNLPPPPLIYFSSSHPPHPLSTSSTSSHPPPPLSTSSLSHPPPPHLPLSSPPYLPPPPSPPPPHLIVISFLFSQTQLITSKGYPAEEHYVTTPDGYILGVHRIPHGKHESSKNSKIYHMTMMSCDQSNVCLF